MRINGSPSYSIENKTANLLQTTVKAAKPIHVWDNDEANRMVCYNGYKTLSFGWNIAPIESGGWTMTSASFFAADGRRGNILERNIFPLIGVHLHQQKPAGKSVNLNSDDTNFNFTITNWVSATYQGLCTRMSKSKNPMVRTSFLSDFKALQEKCRRTPMHIQEKVERKSQSLYRSRTHR